MECQYCGRNISNKGSLKSHEMCCGSNPDRTSHKHSPDAGVKKGNVPWNAGKKTGRRSGRVNGYGERKRDDEVFVENSTYARKNLKQRIIEQNMIPYTCSCCGIGPEWNGKPMPLILDHINGTNNDNRLENLRFVCSNCDSQLDTYKSRNKRKANPIGDGSCLENSRGLVAPLEFDSPAFRQFPV